MYPFDRIDLVISGEILTARPVEFTLTKDNTPVHPIRYEATCPGCGQLVSFVFDDILMGLDEEDKKKYVRCIYCKKSPFIPVKKNEVKISPVGQHSTWRELIGDVAPIQPFSDPFEDGIFDPNQYEFA